VFLRAVVSVNIVWLTVYWLVGARIRPITVTSCAWWKFVISKVCEFMTLARLNILRWWTTVFDQTRSVAAALVIAAGLFAGGCSSDSVGGIGDYVWGCGDAKPPPGASETPSAEDTTPVAELYNKGMAAMQEGDYKDAVKEFGEVERLHPYSS